MLNPTNLFNIASRNCLAGDTSSKSCFFSLNYIYLEILRNLQCNFFSGLSLLELDAKHSLTDDK